MLTAMPFCDYFLGNLERIRQWVGSCCVRRCVTSKDVVRGQDQNRESYTQVGPHLRKKTLNMQSRYIYLGNLPFMFHDISNVCDIQL